LCRLNSTGDVNHGAVGYPEISPHYYQVKERRKRFFDRPAVDALFGPEWRRLSVKEHTIQRFQKPKVVWEVVLEKKE
jgi:hypothetical protein